MKYRLIDYDGNRQDERILKATTAAEAEAEGRRKWEHLSAYDKRHYIDFYVEDSEGGEVWDAIKEYATGKR